MRPNTTLFIVNFDVMRVRTRDVERYFEPYGRLKRVEIKKVSYTLSDLKCCRDC